MAAFHQLLIIINRISSLARGYLLKLPTKTFPNKFIRASCNSFLNHLSTTIGIYEKKLKFSGLVLSCCTLSLIHIYDLLTTNIISKNLMSSSWLAGSPFPSEIQIMWEILKGLKTRLVTINQFNFVSVCKLKTIPQLPPRSVQPYDCYLSIWRLDCLKTC